MQRCDDDISPELTSLFQCSCVMQQTNDVMLFLLNSHLNIEDWMGISHSVEGLIQKSHDVEGLMGDSHDVQVLIGKFHGVQGFMGKSHGVISMLLEALQVPNQE